jgi:hypothetical protein
LLKDVREFLHDLLKLDVFEVEDDERIGREWGD